MDHQSFLDMGIEDVDLAKAAATTHQQLRMALHMLMGTPALKECGPDAVVAIAQVIATNHLARVTGRN
jgi:hypothetical protein